jgi:heat shock protein HslJ
MNFRILLLVLLVSMNAYAKPARHATPPQDESSASQNDTTVTIENANKQLTSHGWQISRITENPSFTTNPDRWYFNLNSNGRYKAYGACNYFSGVYKTDMAGSFKISTLDSSNNQCDNTKNEEVMIFNELLMIDSFEINEGILMLKSAGLPALELQASDKIVEVTVVHKVRSAQNTDKPHGKKGAKGNKNGKSDSTSKGKAKGKSSAKGDTPAKAKPTAKSATAKPSKKKQSLH